MALPRRWAQALATSAQTAANPSPASRTTGLELGQVAAPGACFPLPPTLKLGNLGLACWPMASSRSSSSSMVAPLPHPVGDLVEPQSQLVVGIAARLCASVADDRQGGLDESWTGGGSGVWRGTRSCTSSQLSSKAWARDLQGRGLDAGGEQQQDGCVRVRGRPGARRGTMDQRVSKATEELTSSSTSTRGGRPASTGCSESRRWAKACSVPMAAPSSWSRASRQRTPDVTVGIGFGRLLERGPDAVAQLGARLLGKGDGGDTAEFDAAGRHQGQDAVDQGRGLAGSGAGLDEEGGVEVLGDPLARRLIGGGGRLVDRRAAQSSASCSVSVSTSMSSSGWAKFTKASMASSACLCSY